MHNVACQEHRSTWLIEVSILQPASYLGFILPQVNAWENHFSKYVNCNLCKWIFIFFFIHFPFLITTCIREFSQVKLGFKMVMRTIWKNHLIWRRHLRQSSIWTTWKKIENRKKIWLAYKITLANCMELWISRKGKAHYKLTAFEMNLH